MRREILIIILSISAARALITLRARGSRCCVQSTSIGADASADPKESTTGADLGVKQERKLTPLQRALLSDRPTGRYVSDGWTDEKSRGEFTTSTQHFESFARLETFADKFLAIDE